MDVKTSTFRSVSVLVGFLLVSILNAFTLRAHGDAMALCDCNAVLIPSLEYGFMSKTERLVALTLIDRETFRKHKEGGGGGIDLMVEGLPIGAYADYNAFSVARDAELKRENINLTQVQAEGMIRNYIPTAAFDTYIKCKEECSKSLHGFHSWASYADLDTVTVTFPWNPPPNVIEGKVESSYLVGASTIDAPTGRVFPAGFTFKGSYRLVRIFKRDMNKPFVLGVNVSGYSTELHLSPYSPKKLPEKPPAPPHDAKAIFAGDAVLIRGTQGDPYLQIEGEKVLAGNPEKATTLIIEKAAKNQGRIIREGDVVLIRGLKGDPYIRVEQGKVLAGNPERATTFIIKKTHGSAGSEIREGDWVLIRGVKGDPYLRVEAGIVYAGNPEYASNFAIKKQ